MATTTWTGASSETFSDNANWTGNTPASGDVGIIPKTAANNIAGEDRSGVNISKLSVQEGSTVQIGTSGTPLQIAGDLFVFRGQAPVYLQAATGTSDDVHMIFVDSPRRDANSTPALTLTDDGTSNLLRMAVQSGYVLCGSAATNAIDRLEVCGPQATVSVESGFGTITDAFVTEGYLILDDAVTTLHLGASGRVLVNQADGQVITGHIFGSMDYRSDETITLLNIFGPRGFTDFSMADRSITVTTTNVIGAGARINQGDGQVTFTNSPSIIGGGTIQSSTGGAFGL